MSPELSSALAEAGLLAKLLLQESGFAFSDGLSGIELERRASASALRLLRLCGEACLSAGVDPPKAWRSHVDADFRKLVERTGLRPEPLATVRPGEAWEETVLREAPIARSRYALQGTREWGAAETATDLLHQLAAAATAEASGNSVGFASEMMDVAGHAAILSAPRMGGEKE
jgi:hypothetical protein